MKYTTVFSKFLGRTTEWLILVSLTLLIVFLSESSGHAQMAVWETARSGKLNGINFEFANLGRDVYLYHWDFSNPKYYLKAQGKQQKCVSYVGSENWHLMFSQKVNDLVLYIGAWRPGVYQFSSSFRVISKSKNIRVIDDFILVDEKLGKYGHAMLKFDKPLCCLFIESSLKSAGEQVFTFGIYEMPILVCGNTEVIVEEEKSFEFLRNECNKKAKAFPMKNRAY